MTILPACSLLRRQNWDVALQAWADAQVGQPYAWGHTDCVSLAIAAIRVLYPQQDPAALPAFPSKAAALRALAADPDLLVQSLEWLGAVPLALGYTQAGDLLVAPTDAAGEPALLVGLGAWAIAATPAEGVVRIRTRQLRADTVTWRLPHG